MSDVPDTSTINGAIRAAVLAERERCAAICDELEERDAKRSPFMPTVCPSACAAAIRAQEQP